MQAIIMAGGKGTRLRPITNTIPKSLVPLHNKTLLDYVINHAKKEGCDNIIICAGHMADMIENHIARNDYGMSIKLSRESEPLGTAGALHLIKHFLDDTFFILYSDVFTTINLRKMYRFHTQKNADITVALHTSDHPQDSTVVTIDKNGRLVKLVEKPGNEWIHYGNITMTSLYLLKKNVIDFIPRSKQIDLTKDVFPKMLEKNKRLFGYVTQEFAKDIGTPERYKSVLQLLNS